jgi:glycosyltransferase involved in cell wall biosynthesis
MRVLHVNYGKLYGGVETILVTLARLRHLCPSMEPSFALCEEGRLSQELEDTGADVHIVGSVRISRPWTVWRARKQLRKVLDREHFDIVVCHMPWSLVVFGPAVRSSGAKLGFWAHAYHGGRHWLDRLARRVPPDVAIANSRFTQGGLANLFKRVANGVVYPPIELGESQTSDQLRREVRAANGADDDTVVIIQVSRIEAGKGHLAHLEALFQLNAVEREWVCWFVGGAQKPEEHQLLEELKAAALRKGIADHIRFLGQRSDVGLLLDAADVFCQPNSSPESFGIVFVEALSRGVPVITTAFGGAAEVVDDSCGVLIEPGDCNALVSAIRHLIENRELRKELGGSGIARARGLFEPRSQMRTLDELLCMVACAVPGEHGDA